MPDRGARHRAGRAGRGTGHGHAGKGLTYWPYQSDDLSMHGGHSIPPDSLAFARAVQRVEYSSNALAALLTECESLRVSLVAGTHSLARREAVTAMDEAAGLLALATDALRDGEKRLHALEAGDLTLELIGIVGG